MLNSDFILKSSILSLLHLYLDQWGSQTCADTSASLAFWMLISSTSLLWSSIYVQYVIIMNEKWVLWSFLIVNRMFVGDRPYWWIGETSLYTDETRPQLRKFPNTCEAGPGTPSGHLMMNVALFFVITRGISTEFIWKWKRIR